MFGLTAALIFTFVGSQPLAEQQRIVDESGAVTVFEAVPGSKTIAMHLFAAAKGCQETPDRHGWRHLLEHLVAKGTDSQLAFKLETAGWNISAETFRDFTTYKLEGPANRWQIGFEALADIVSSRKWTQEQLSHELKILNQELALATLEAKLRNQAWLLAFGNAGLDPAGTSESIAQATPESLTTLFNAQMAADNLTLSIVGPSPIPGLEAKCKTIWKLAPKAKKAVWIRRTKTIPGSDSLELGSVVFASAPGFGNPTTAWTLAAALAIASEGESRFVSYTPSLFAGLVLLGSTSESRIGAVVSGIQSQSDRLYETGRQLALGWLARHLQSTGARANWNGIFQCQAIGGRPDSLAQSIETMTLEDFRTGMSSFIEGAANGETRTLLSSMKFKPLQGYPR